MTNNNDRNPIFLRNIGTRRAEKAGIEIDLKPVVKAGEDYVKRVPLVIDRAKEILPSLIEEKTASLTEAFKKLSDWRPLTYKRGTTGTPKDNATAHLYNVLYGQIRKQIAAKAPLASAGQTGLSKISGLGEFGGRLLKHVLIGGAVGGAGVAVGGGVLNKLFPQLFER